MTKTMIDIPDDFKNELIYNAARGGATIRLQVLVALQEKWGWGVDRLPLDGRYKDFVGAGKHRPVVTNGQTPRGGLPMDKKGNFDPSPALDRADEALAGKLSHPTPPTFPADAEAPKYAVHPEDKYYKSPDDKPFPGAEPAAIIGALRGDEEEF